MARLVYEITGDISGLQSAINTGINLIQKLSDTPNQVKINVPDISAQIVKGVAALDQLGSKLDVIRGNAVLFGDSLKGQTQELNAYQSAINTLLANGFDPLDGDVQRLKIHIDELTNSFHNVQSAQASVGNNAKESFAEVQAFLNANRNAQAPTQNVAVNAPFGGSDPSRGVLTGLNQQLLAGTISVQEYNAALAEANLSIHAISESEAGSTSAFEAQIGVIQGLKEQLASLNAQRIVAPQEDLARINAEIQQTEVSLQQATNIGKVGFDQMGNSIRGVSVQNINGQLFALSNNLFGARQISKDLVRTFDSTSVGTFARSIGLLGVDFLFFAQNAQFAKVSTVGATAAMAVEGEVAAASALTTGALGAAFKSLLTPTSLIVLAIAAAGAAFIAFEESQKKAHTALTQSEEDLKAFNAVQKDSASEFGKAVAPLQQLYDVTQNLNISENRRLEAAQRLRDIFPEQFQNTTNLAIVNGELRDSYDKLTDSLLKNAVAQAAQKQIGEQELKIALAQEQITKIRIANANEIAKSRQDEKNGSFDVEGGGILAADNIDKSNKRAKDAIAEQNAIAQQARNTIRNILEPLASDFSTVTQKLADANKLLGANLENFNSLLNKSTDKTQFENIKNALQTKLDSLAPGDSQIANLRAKIKQVEEIIKEAYTVKLTGGSKVDPFAAISNSLTEIFNKINAKSSDSGLKGYELTVQKIKDEYIRINAELDKQQQKLTALQKAGLSPARQNEKDNLQVKLDTDRALADKAKEKELSDAKIAEAERVANEIQRINDEFGVRADVSRSRELAQVQKMYDAEVVKARGNKDILDALNADRLIAVKGIDDKYIQQEQQVYDRIADIANAAMANLVTGEEARTDKIILEGQKRVTAANAEFNKLRDLAKGLPQASTDKINNIQAQVNLLINQSTFEKVSEEISKNFASAMQTAVNGFVSNFYTAITSLGQQRQDIDNKYASQLSKASNQATINQINNLKRLEKQSTLSFGSIFSSLVSKFQSAFNESILSSFTKQFTENLGKTLLTPTAKQLTISPEEQSAQNVAVLLKTAGSDLASQITQAGNAFAAKISTISIDKGLLNGASGGSLLQASGLSAKDSIITPALTSQLAVSGEQAGKAIETGGAAAAAATVGAAAAAATTTTTAASTAAGKISSAAAGIAAAASLAGGLISGATSPTSSAGQGIGGALSGAGEGALLGTSYSTGIGTIVGAAAGFLIGGISGIFSASKARKQEELQKKQLEQQQETNALLARANALAYTASIVGRMTTQGIVTGADVNAFGQLTATVNGKTLQFVLDRSSNGR